MKKIYKIWQDVNNDYDTYSDAIVCAESPEKAKKINPGEYYKWHEDGWYFQYSDGTEEKQRDSSWADPKDIQVKEVGIAHEDCKVGEVICSSFHAG